VQEVKPSIQQQDMPVTAFLANAFSQIIQVLLREANNKLSGSIVAMALTVVENRRL
jgi:hypothetical protein